MQRLILSLLISLLVFAFGCGRGADGNSFVGTGTVKSVVSDGNTVWAITENGRLYSWGSNQYGVVGNGLNDGINVVIPYEVAAVGKVKEVVTSGQTVYTITEDGKLYSWGSNQFGQVGNTYTYGIKQLTPYEVEEVGTIKSVVAAVGSTVYAIAEDGKLYAWGSNNSRFGNGMYDDSVTPCEIVAVGKVKSLVTNSQTVYAITTDDRLYTWGSNQYGGVGNGISDGISVPNPYEVATVGKVKEVVVSSGYTVYAINTEGKLYAWGSNSSGQIGNSLNDGSNVVTPYEVAAVGKVKEVVTSGHTVYAITEDGKLYSWGSNQFGQVGNIDTYGINQLTPYEVKEVGIVKSVVAAVGSTVYAIAEDGKLYAWGSNRSRFGNGMYDDSVTPCEIVAVGKVKSLVTNSQTVYAITEDGKLYSWGNNQYGGVGNGISDGISVPNPYEVATVGKVKEVVASSGYTVYAIAEDGKLYAWGNNLNGQIGNGSSGENVLTPILVHIPKY